MEERVRDTNRVVGVLSAHGAIRFAFIIGRITRGNKRSYLFLFFHFPVYKLHDLGVVQVEAHHFGSTTCGTSTFDGAGCTVADFDKVIKPGKSGKVHANVDTTGFAGPIAKAVMEAGELVSDAIVSALIGERLDDDRELGEQRLGAVVEGGLLDVGIAAGILSKTGAWFNYGDVNGLDFWNNSDAIKPEQASKYGTITTPRMKASVWARDRTW